jgi:hypothetical protein
MFVDLLLITKNADKMRLLNTLFKFLYQYDGILKIV